jgi:hypothetical protein
MVLSPPLGAAVKALWRCWYQRLYRLLTPMLLVLPPVLLCLGGGWSASTAAAAEAEAQQRFVIVCGSGGTAEYERLFLEWGQRLQRVLVEGAGHRPGQVLLLNGGKAATAAQIGAALLGPEQGWSRDGVLFLFLIGHGSYRDGVAKFMVPGPDLSADSLAVLLGRMAPPTAVLINAASSSAPFINVLSGPGRIVCTSTKSAEQRNAPVFMEHFVGALEDGSADGDLDERVSVYEVCTQAAALTAAWYEGENLIAVEHALLDDDGDGLGVRLGMADASGPAAAVYLWDWPSGPTVPAIWREEYRQALDEVHQWIGRKEQIEKAVYLRRLEELLVRAARLNQRLRSED